MKLKNKKGQKMARKLIGIVCTNPECAITFFLNRRDFDEWDDEIVCPFCKREVEFEDDDDSGDDDEN